MVKKNIRDRFKITIVSVLHLNNSAIIALGLMKFSSMGNLNMFKYGFDERMLLKENQKRFRIWFEEQFNKLR